MTDWKRVTMPCYYNMHDRCPNPETCECRCHRQSRCKHEWVAATKDIVDVRCSKCDAYKCDVCGKGTKNPFYGLCHECAKKSDDWGGMAE